MGKVIDKWSNGKQSPETEPSTYIAIDFLKMCQNISTQKEKSFNKLLKQLDIILGKKSSCITLPYTRKLYYITIYQKN